MRMSDNNITMIEIIPENCRQGVFYSWFWFTGGAGSLEKIISKLFSPGI
jgi:hypothetical protein